MTTENERNWPELHRQVCFGESGGRIIWQPRIGCWYNDKQFAGEPLPEPYEGLSREDIFRRLDCSARLYRHYNPCFRRVEHRDVRFESTWLNDLDEGITITTPVGTQQAVHRHSPNNAGIIHLKWEVETEDELRVATWREENGTWRWDQERFDRAQREVGDLGAPTVYMPRMNVQCLYIEKMGTQNGIYALHDWPETVEAFFRAREENHDRLIDLINDSPIDIINFGENIHAGTLPPDLFQKYHLPACRRRCERLHAAGKFCLSHWDGDCRPLLPFARETGLDGIEAITPRPQGDVTLEEVKEALGDEMFLLDGIPAVYFDETYSVDELLDCVRELIDLFAPKLVLGISDEISSTGDIERIRVVGEIVDEYNEAVSDHE
ncbi:MAG: uroporphyrinogen decarboxylase family protein [Planctomycetota bacterium]